MWERHVEPNLPKEPTPEEVEAEGKANAIAAAIMLGLNPLELLKK